MFGSLEELELELEGCGCWGWLDEDEGILS